jgi:hypothetical protein
VRQVYDQRSPPALVHNCMARATAAIEPSLEPRSPEGGHHLCFCRSRAKRATTKIPIVLAYGGDYVAGGLAQNLACPVVSNYRSQALYRRFGRPMRSCVVNSRTRSTLALFEHFQRPVGVHDHYQLAADHLEHGQVGIDHERYAPQRHHRNPPPDPELACDHLIAVR